MGEARNLLDRRTLAIVLLLLAGVAGSQWLRIVNEPTAPTMPESHAPDYAMDDFDLTAMGSNGLPVHQLDSPFMAHYPDNDTTEFNQPHIVIYRQLAEPWHINGGHGWMSGDHSYILFGGAVRIDNPTAKADQAMRLDTHELRVLAVEEYADTDQPVTIRTQNSLTEGVGMHAYIKQGRLQLLSKVRGTYAPNTHPAEH